MFKERRTEQQSEKEPEINYHILFITHRTAKDYAKVGQNLKQCDIYIPELFAWHQKMAREYQQLSEGKITPGELAWRYETGSNSLAKYFWSILYQSHKPIILIDVPSNKDNPQLTDFFDKDAKNDQQFKVIFQKFCEGQLNKAIELAKIFFVNSTKLYLEREEIMKNSLEKKVKTTIKNNPTLSKKKKINVLLTLGAAHTSFYHWLKKEHPDNSRQILAESLIVHDAFSECLLRKIYHKPISDLLIARGLVERLLANYFYQFTDDSIKNMRLLRKMSECLTLDDIRQISQRFKDKKNGVYFYRNVDCYQIVINYLKKRKGIHIPTSEKEIDKSLN